MIGTVQLEIAGPVRFRAQNANQRVPRRINVPVATPRASSFKNLSSRFDMADNEYRSADEDTV
jgi:hypothetical protein